MPFNLNTKNISILQLIPNSLVYCINYIYYKIIYKQSFVSPRSFLFNTKLKGQNIIYGGNMFENCIIGEYTYFSGSNAGGIVSHFTNTKFGKFCSIATNIEIIITTHNPKAISSYPFFDMKKKFFIPKTKTKDLIYQKVKIGNDVWIGANVTILGGVKIGNGAVIGAGAVVTKNIEPYAVAVGVPAKTIKYRFSQDKIKKLQKIKWWDFPKEKLDLYTKTLIAEDFDKFYKLYKSNKSDKN